MQLSNQAYLDHFSMTLLEKVFSIDLLPYLLYWNEKKTFFSNQATSCSRWRCGGLKGFMVVRDELLIGHNPAHEFFFFVSTPHNIASGFVSTGRPLSSLRNSAADQTIDWWWRWRFATPFYVGGIRFFLQHRSLLVGVDGWMDMHGQSFQKHMLLWN